MNGSAPVHPLDVELADLVDGVLAAGRAAAVEAHVAACLLCRLKHVRLSSSPPGPADGGKAPGPSPPYPVLPGGVPTGRGSADDDDEPVAGDLWIAGGDEGILVLVLRARGSGALVVPVTFDVDAADEEAVVVDGGAWALGVGLAAYPALATELSRSVLRARLASCPPELVATVAAGPGAAGPAGAPISGPADPRLEVRQELADRLAALDEHPADPDAGADAPPPPGPEELRASLIADLRARRGHTCAVRALYSWGDVLPAAQAGWEALATVDEVGVVLVVLDTPHGLADDADYHVGRSVLTRFGATALVVLARRVSEEAEVFDSASLNHGIEAPSGRHAPPRPLVAGLSPLDAVAKYLDQTTGARAGAPPSRGPVSRVDVGHVLREATAEAVADTVRQGARFRIVPKRRAYESVAGVAERLQDVVARSVDADPGAVVAALLELAPEPEAGADG